MACFEPKKAILRSALILTSLAWSADRVVVAGTQEGQRSTLTAACEGSQSQPAALLCEVVAYKTLAPVARFKEISDDKKSRIASTSFEFKVK